SQFANHKVYAISDEGKVLYTVDLDPKKERINMLIPVGDELIISGLYGDYSKMFPKFGNSFFRKVDAKGQIAKEEEYNPEKMGFKQPKGREFPMVFPREHYWEGEDLIFVFDDQREDQFILTSFSGKDLSYKGKVEYPKQSRFNEINQMDLMYYLFDGGFRYTQPSTKGNYRNIVFFSRDTKKLALQSCQTKDNKKEVVYESFDNESTSAKVKINWYDAFPGADNTAIFCYYRKKQKAIYLYRVAIE
ncbi:MAG: hypothetical protein AAFP19_26370, partial [Bacteroidota bacterium]